MPNINTGSCLVPRSDRRAAKVDPKAMTMHNININSGSATVPRPNSKGTSTGVRKPQPV